MMRLTQLIGPIICTITAKPNKIVFFDGSPSDDRPQDVIDSPKIIALDERQMKTVWEFPQFAPPVLLSRLLCKEDSVLPIGNLRLTSPFYCISLIGGSSSVTPKLLLLYRALNEGHPIQCVTRQLRECVVALLAQEGLLQRSQRSIRLHVFEYITQPTGRDVRACDIIKKKGNGNIVFGWGQIVSDSENNSVRRHNKLPRCSPVTSQHVL